MLPNCWNVRLVFGWYCWAEKPKPPNIQYYHIVWLCSLATIKYIVAVRKAKFKQLSVYLTLLDLHPVPQAHLMKRPIISKNNSVTKVTLVERDGLENYIVDRSPSLKTWNTIMHLLATFVTLYYKYWIFPHGVWMWPCVSYKICKRMEYRAKQCVLVFCCSLMGTALNKKRIKSAVLL